MKSHLYIIASLILLLLLSGCPTAEESNTETAELSSEKWSCTTGDYNTSPAIADDGTVYIGAITDIFYAVYSVCGGPAESPWPRFHHDNQNTGMVD